MKTFTIQRGTIHDYLALSACHYRAHSPATITRVWRVQHDQPSLIARFDPHASHRTHARTIAVLTESMPMLDSVMRRFALQNRYENIRSKRLRAKLINEELRCISRVVVHPQYRGLGLAVRLVKHALAHAATIYTESHAAMGHVHPFFERAGMTAYPRPAHACDDRLKAALQSVGLDPLQLALLETSIEHLQKCDNAQQQFITRELLRWHQHHFRKQAADADRAELLRQARTHLICSPVYYLHKNAVDARSTSCEPVHFNPFCTRN